MKKLILLFTLLFTVSTSFMSCRNNVEDNDEVLEDEYVTEDETLDDDVIASDFGDYDLDDDGYWDSDEFGDAYEEDWSTWDLDGDGYLDENEFYTTSYGWIDANDDDLIDETEWNEGYNNLYGGYADVGDFDSYDLNDDGFLDNDEWFQGWGDSDWFNDYDLDDDGFVDNDEWDEGIFANWDEDDDGYWDEDEYNLYSGYYDTW